MNRLRNKKVLTRMSNITKDQEMKNQPASTLHKMRLSDDEANGRNDNRKRGKEGKDCS